MKSKALKRVLSIFLVFCVSCSSFVVAFGAGAVASSVLKYIGSYLVDRLADYVWDTATGTQAQAQYAADKIAVLSVIRDWCVENNYDPNCNEFQQFILDMYLEAPDNDEMTSRYGSDWSDLHSQIHPYFAKLSSIYQCGWEEAYNWIVEHYDDDSTKLTPEGTVQIPSDDFVDFVDQQNTLTTPKGKDLFIQSFGSDSRWRSFERVNNHGSIMQNPYIPLFDDTQKTQLKDLWLVPFYQDENSVRYYSDYQFHLYYVSNDDPNSDIALQLDLYRVDPEFGKILQSPYSGIVAEFTSATVPLSIVFNTYLSYRTDKTRGISEIYSLTLDDYLNGEITFTHNFTGHLSEEYLPKEIFQYKSSDGSKVLNIYKGADGFPDSKFEYCLKKSTAAPNEDIGFICSHSLIERTYTDIDTSKIPPNQVINITGDTIYDYSITNPETGQTSTINNYITNNYNYPALPTTSGGGSGGGAGGDVNVTGSIGVHGDVGVDVTVSVPDININVNQGNGAGGNGGGTAIDPDDFLNGSSVDLDKYYDDAVSQASGVRSFMEQFFDFLPPEIVGLVGLLVVVAILCRIFGR